MLKKMIIIVDRDVTKDIIEIGQSQGAIYTTGTLIKGTANSALLEYLGLGESEKAMIHFIAEDVIIKKIFLKLSVEMHLSKPGHGIAFTIPLASVGGKNVMDMLTGHTEKATYESKEALKLESHHDLIIAIVNKGFAETVMSAAREAGARGGSIIPAHGTKPDGEGEFMGVKLRSEKECVYILEDRDRRHHIMQAIVDKAGLTTEGRGFVYALPVCDILGLATITE